MKVAEAICGAVLWAAGAAIVLATALVATGIVVAAVVAASALTLPGGVGALAIVAGNSLLTEQRR